MSRPIFSRPRTRVYGCNYDKGESYYKPMVDHLDRKYSSRPLFSEPRTSFADEIAARRSDIGSRGDQSAAQSSLRDLDLEFDMPRSRGRGKLQDSEDESVYDIRGQRVSDGGGRRSMAEDFTSEVASTTRRFRSALDASSIGGMEDHQSRSNSAAEYEASKNARLAAKSAFDEAENTFKRRSKLLNDVDAFDRLADDKLTRWSKLAEDETHSVGISSAAGRAKQTKARLNDLETEMEEMAERQAKRERRSAALRALVNDAAAATSASDEQLQQSSISSKRLTLRTEKHVNF